MRLFRRLRYWLQASRHQADLSEELEFHRAMLDDAPSLGNTTRAREDARAVWIWPWLETVMQDVRYALRNLRAHPGFTSVAILALGCAIGLNTSFFTVFEAVAIRPWPVKDARRIVRIFSLNTHHMDAPGFSVPEFHYFEEHAHSFAGMIAAIDGGVHFGFEPFGKVTTAMFVDAGHFRVLGVNMALGRGFVPEENRVEAPEHVIVLSFTLWRDHFGSDPETVGRTVRVEDIPFTVVGVAPEDFLGTSQGREDAWLPFAVFPEMNSNQGWARAWVRDPDRPSLVVAGRLAPGITRTEAHAELDGLSRQFHAQFKLDPVRIVLADSTMMAAQPGGNGAVPVLALMFAGVTLIVLLACANVGNLLISRAAARRLEIETRRALGASRARIVRQLMTESVLLSLAASALGIAFAYRLPDLVVRRLGEAPPVLLKPDLIVLAYALALGMFCCLTFGLAPALHGTGIRKQRARLPLRSVLLAAQVAMSVVLLTSAALLLEGVRHFRTRDPGFSFRDVAVVSLELPAGSYNRARITDFTTHLLTELNGLPALQPFALCSQEPWSNSIWELPLRLPGEDRSVERAVTALAVSPGYFDVLRLPILAGRNFDPGDKANTVILVNQSMARHCWRDQNPVGKTIMFMQLPMEVIGVVRDTLDRAEPVFYQPLGVPFPPKVLVRTAPGVVEAVAATVQRLDKRVRTEAKPLSESMARAAAPARIGAQLAAARGVRARASDHWDFRRLRLHRSAANQGNRHPHGAGSAPATGDRARPRRHVASRSYRLGRRILRGRRRRPPAG
jgi:predicted permease